MHFDIDTTILVVYIIVNVCFGFYWGRNVKTIQDYALGGRNFSTGTLVATIMASWVGGEYLFSDIAETYTGGFYFVLGCTGMSFGLLLLSYVFIPRMGEFLGAISVAEALGDLYGKYVRIISAATGCFVSAGFMAMQFKVFGDIFKSYLGISEYTIFFAGVTIVMYSAFGGIRSVAFTDVIQFFTFGVLVPVLSIILWNQFISSGDADFSLALADPKYNPTILFDPDNPQFWQMIVLFIFCMIPGFDPALFQRISIGKSIEQVQQAFNISAVLLLLVVLGVSWIGFLLFNVDPNLEPKELMHYIMNHHAHVGLKGFILIGIVAMCMSKADANLNSASVILTHDFCYPLGIKLKNELFLSKVIAICLGCLGIYLASLDYSLLSLSFLVQSFHGPIAAIPLIFAILGFRTTNRVVLSGMASGFITVIIWRCFFMDVTGIDSMTPGMVGNTVVLFGMHYLLKEKGGWIDTTTPTLIQARLARKRAISNFFSSLKNFSILQFCKNNAPKNDLTYTVFGVFSLISTICTMYSTPATDILSKNTLLFFYETMLILSVSFITYPIWPRAIKKETPVQIIWNLSVFYILIICSSFFVMLNNFSQIPLMICMVNLIVVATLVRWQAALSLIIIGIIFTIELYQYYMGVKISHTAIVSMEIKVVYLLLLLSSMLIMFFKPRQEEYELTEARNDHLGEKIQSRTEELQRLSNLKSEFIRNLNHELHTPVTGITSMAQGLLDNYDTLAKQELRDSIRIIAQSAERFNSYTSSILDLSKISSLNFKLNIEKINLSNLIYNRLDACKKLYLSGKKLQFITNIEPDIILDCDKHYMQLVFDNLIINAISYSKEGTITLTLKNKDNRVTFSIEDEGIGIPRNELFDIFEAFTVSSKTRTPAGGRGVGLALCKKSIEAHKGLIWAESNGSKGSTFRFEIGL